MILTDKSLLQMFQCFCDVNFNNLADLIVTDRIWITELSKAGDQNLRS